MSSPLPVSAIQSLRSPLPAPNVLLQGATGTGKTTAILTLIKSGIVPFCIFAEPGFEVLAHDKLGVLGKPGALIPPEQLHWQYIAPAPQTWEGMMQSAKNINMLSFEAISKMTDSKRTQHDQFHTFLGALNNYKCDRDGTVYGDVCDWGTGRAIVVDGLSGVSDMALGLVVGSKPVRHQGDWGIAMQLVANLFQKLCTDTRAMFILIAHEERELDEVQGGSRIMASTLGRKLAPKLPRFFSDVIHAERSGTKFTWSTATVGADLKARNLPIQDGLEPSFEAIIKNWKAQGGIIE
jgi:AAA domain